jgi:SigmaW regulon antibacterial
MTDFLERNWGWLTFVLIATPIVSVVGFMWLRAWHLSLGAWMKGVTLSIHDIMLMQLRHVDTNLLVNQLIVAKQNGLVLDATQLTTHMMAGGNIRQVIAAMLSARRFAIPLTLERACAVDLIGQDPLRLIADAVHEAGKITVPTKDNGFSSSSRPTVNPASVLLQAAPGTKGMITVQPNLTARVRFPQGELDVIVHSGKVPKPGDHVRITSVDGLTVTVEPALA